MADVKAALTAKIYRVVHKTGEAAGKYYRVIGQIVDQNGKQVKGAKGSFFWCIKCDTALEFAASSGTKPLNSHADRCDLPKKAAHEGLSHWLLIFRFECYI